LEIRPLEMEHCGAGTGVPAMSLILLIILILLLLGSFPTWPYSREWGYGPSGGLGTILLILLVVYLLGYI
jgi:hypothetical protein